MTMSIPSCPSWHGLRRLGKSPLSRLTIFIPVFGILIIFSNATAEFITMSAEFIGVSGDEAIKISRRNVFFWYFGLFIFSTSTVLFDILCPPVVKDFANEYEFSEAELKIITQKRAEYKLATIKDKYNPDINFDFNISNTPGKAAHALGVNNKNETREYWLKEKSDPVANLLHHEYEYENSSYIIWRRIIFGGYVVASVLIAIPSIVTLCRVISTSIL